MTNTYILASRKINQIPRIASTTKSIGKSSGNSLVVLPLTNMKRKHPAFEYIWRALRLENKLGQMFLKKRLVLDTLRVPTFFWHQIDMVSYHSTGGNFSTIWD